MALKTKDWLRAEARDRALGVLYLYGNGLSVSEIATIEGTSRARVYQLIRQASRIGARRYRMTRGGE